MFILKYTDSFVGGILLCYNYVKISLKAGGILKIQMKVRKYLGTYKFHSVFVRIFIVVLGMCLALILFFCIFIWRIMSNQIQDQSEQINGRMLQQTSNVLDTAVSYVKNDMEGIFYNNQVVKSMVVPDMTNAERNFQVVRCLEDLVHNNPYISGAFLYLPTDQTVFTSEGQIALLKEYEDSVLCDLYKGEDLPAENQLIYRDQRMFLMMDYPFKRPDHIGTVAIELDKQALYHLLQTGRQEEKSSLYILDAADRPVFAGILEYPDALLARIYDHQDALLARERGAIDEITDVFSEKGWACYAYENPNTGWRYIYKSDHSSLDTAAQKLFLILLPVIIVVFLLSIYSAFYITRHIYKPIQKLMDSILNKGRMVPLKESRNEFDFLNKAYEEEYDRQQRISKLAERAYPLIWKTLFTDLLLGRCTEEEIRTAIREIPGGYGPEDYYAVIAATVKQSEDISAIDSDVCFLGIFNCIQELQADTCEIYPVIIEKVCVAVIMGFKPQVSDASIKKTVLNLIRQIKACVQGLPFETRINPGRVCYSIYNLPYSYQDALENMKYQVYYGLDDQEETRPSGERKLFGYEYFSARMEPLAESIRRNHVDEALFMAETMIHEITGSLTEINEVCEACNKLIDMLIQKMLDFRVSEQEDIFEETRKYLQSSLNPSAKPQQIEERTIQFARQSVRLMGIYYQKQQHKYVVSVKEYIANNYFNSSISLSSTAEYIGINTSYLSKLFRDNAGEHFTDYLNKYRIEKAKQLLSSTHFTIQEIGFKTGFNTIQNFNRVFKKIVGKTPGQYRGK